MKRRIGTGKRTGEGYVDTPGPGHYTYVDETRGPKFAFTRELRGDKQRYSNPGPAGKIYSIQTTKFPRVFLMCLSILCPPCSPADTDTDIS